MDYVLLSQLSLKQQCRKIKVRIGRMWDAKIPTMREQILSLDCLLIDEKGDSIQATIRKQDAIQFRQSLEEGNVYFIENFTVIPSKKFKVVDEDYMVMIGKWTKVVRITENIDSMPLYSFKFVSFDCIHNRRNNDSCLSDVLGRVVTLGSIGYTYVGQAQTPIRKLEIEDLQKNKLSVTLWDNFAVEIDENFIFERDANGPVVVVLAAMTVRTYQDKIYLSTSSASKLYMELQIPEVIDFQRRIQQPIDRINRTANTQQATISPLEEMQLNRKKISELMSLEQSEIQNVKFTCEATLKSIDCSYGWWYKASRRCKSAIKSYGEEFCCGQCGENDEPPMPWYKLDATVDDETGDANFTIFGKVAQDLIHVPADKLATADDSDRFTLPLVIKNIIGRKHIFQVTIDTYKLSMGIRSFKVSKCFSSEVPTKVQNQLYQKDRPRIEEQIVLTPSAHTQNDIFGEISPSTITHSRLSKDAAELALDIEESGRKRLRLTGDEGPSSSNT